MSRELKGKLLDNVKEIDTCWVWIGPKSDNGDCQICIEGEVVSVNRLSWELFRGNIPVLTKVLNKCGTPNCVNPYHLRLETRIDATELRYNTVKTHCPHGHEYTPENIWVRPNDGGKYCRQCRKEQARKYKQIAKLKRIK